MSGCRLEGAGQDRDDSPGAAAGAAQLRAIWPRRGEQAVDLDDGAAVLELELAVVQAVTQDDEDLGADGGDVGLAALRQRHEAVIESGSGVPVLEHAPALGAIIGALGHRNSSSTTVRIT